MKRLLLALLFMAYTLPACADDMTLPTLLARHAQALGQNVPGARPAPGKGARITATYQSGGLTGSLVCIQTAGASRLLAGVIGAQILSRFVVTFDYPHQRMFLAPLPHTQDAYETRTFGVTLFPFTDDGGALRVGVIQVRRNVAKHVKLSVGDEVTQIDGQPVNVLGADEITRLMSAAGGKDTRTLTLRSDRGKTHTVVITLYDPLTQ